MKRVFIHSLFYFILVSTSLNAQLRVDRVIPPSFNASAIIKYCDHPVGVRYGVPKIKIPLQTMLYDDLFVPIKMNYHSIGIKVEEEATWTGLGWHLDAGGVITRIIRGENDLAIADKDHHSNALGYPFEHIKPCLDDCEENENDDFHQKVCNGEIDSDPDIFFFNIMGMTGKFLLTPDHDSTKKELQIEILRPRKMTAVFDMEENIWELTDQYGYQYQFANREKTHALSTYFDFKKGQEHVQFDFDEQSATTSWYLTKITSPKGNIAKLRYDTNIDGDSKYLSNSAYHKMNINDDFTWDVHYSSYCFPDDIENVRVTAEYIHSDVYLKSVTIGDWEATFEKSEQEDIRSNGAVSGAGTNHYISDIAEGYRRQQLDKIVIKRAGEIQKTIEFQYSKFRCNEITSNPIQSHRLKLDSIFISSEDENRRMGFDYVDNFGFPSKESHARDLWGYYNGEEQLYNITPSDFFNYSQPEKLLQEEGKAKHYSLEHIQEGVISKIDFGGGKTQTFKFDHQEFFDIDSEISDHFSENMVKTNFTSHIEPFIFGGLRVKEMVESYPKEKIYKDYFYKIEGKEVGQLVITHYSHSHDGFGHKTSGNHTVKYPQVKIKTGKLFNGHKF